jgi:GNAT superfamily N-acetyltransferase
MIAQDKNLIIREATAADIFELTELMNELGYDTSQKEMEARFLNIQNHPDYTTFVATIDKQVTGMVGLTKNFFYERNGIYVRVVALVINSQFRKRGIGKKLMKASEDWAKIIGADIVLLNCGNREERSIAQRFYTKLGYQVKSSGFIKKI